MFVISKRRFKVPRADGTYYMIPKDHIGEIPDDVFETDLIQLALKDGTVMAPQSTRDKDIYKADEEAEKKAAEADIRPDVKKEDGEEATQKKTTRKK